MRHWLKTNAGLALALACAPALAGTKTTDSSGGGVAFSNDQPSLVLTQTISQSGIFPPRESGGFPYSYLGMVHTFAGNFGPNGSFTTSGQLLSIAQNTALFSLLGTNYGGNGQTNFQLPDLQGKVAIGQGQGPGLANFNVGQQAGQDMVTLGVANLPAHDHSLPGGGVTTTTGGNQPFDNYQPSLAMTYMIATEGVFPSPNSGTGGGFLGEVGLFAGNFAPAGWMAADGQLLSIADNTALFSVIGTTYGGDGANNFALPDLRGRAIVGAGQGPGLANVTLGEEFGSAAVTLSQPQMPAHDHTLDGGPDVTGTTGGNQPFDTEQPSLGLNYLIALQGVFPSREGSGAWSESDPIIGEIVPFAGDFAPRGWAIAAGQLLPIAQNTALFALLGTTYGGNGQTTFALPDLRGRVVVGSGPGFDLGSAFGSQGTTLSVANLAPHTHDYTAAVPEPASWSLMIAGFGVAGAAMRRRMKVTFA